MKKRIFSILLSLALLASLFAVYAPQAQAGLNTVSNFGTNLTWSLNTTTGVLDIAVRGSGSGSMPTNWSSTGAPWYTYRGVINTVVIASGVTNIGQYAFSGCVNLQNVTIPDSATSIGQYAFSGCAMLAGITLPINIGTIGTGAFSGCINLIHFSIGGSWENAKFLIDSGTGVLYELGGAPLAPVRVIKAPAGFGPAYSIPDTIISIDPEAYAYSRLEKIEIPVSVNSIGQNAFSWSVLLREVTFLGNAPQTLPSGSLGLFDHVAGGFRVYFYPYTLRWPAPPSTNWRGYTAIAMTSYVLIDRPIVALEAGKATQLKATVYPTNAHQTVTWAIVDQSDLTPGVEIVTISPEGIVRAGLDTGWADITATSVLPDGLTSITSPATRVYVVDSVVPVSGIALNKTQITMNPGGVAQTLAAIIYPLDATNKELIWSSSNANVAYVDIVPPDPGLLVPPPPSPLQRLVVPVGPGTATITATTVDGSKSASCTVTVTALPVFIPVSNITLSTTSVSTGSATNLNNLATVSPVNATNHNILWRLVSQTTENAELAGSILTVPFGQTGSIVVEATVKNGLAEISSSGENPIDWGYPENIDYTRQFTISVVQFIPVTAITDVPTLAFAGIPLHIRGTVNPVSASYKTIEWEMDSNTAGAYFDSSAGILTAQWPGTIIMKATVRNGRMSGTDRDFEQKFVIKVDPYITHGVDIRANPGGSVSPAGVRQLAGGETIQITATPAQGYVFSGWSATNGGDFADASQTTTTFTMPTNATTVTAFFAYTGLPAGNVGSPGGGVVLPTPVHYFTNGSIYIRNSGVSFGHVTMRDFNLLSHVTLNGRTLSRNAHYTADRTNSFTEIILANGYLDTLSQGSHTLTVHFTDQTTVSAVFSVIWTSYVSTAYSDVYSSDWYAYSVAFVTDRGWMTAKSMTEPGRFRPSDHVSQGEVIDALYRMAGTPTVINQHNQVLQGRDAALEWVRANGILPSSGTYNLNSAITRQDITVLFGRMVTVLRLRYPVVRSAPSFADDWQISGAARSHVVDMYRAGIINGRTVSTFVPLGNMTRAEFAVLLQRFAEAVGGW